jgi:hypothetical protein
MTRHALILNGSPKKEASTSTALALALTRRLEDAGVTVEALQAHRLAHTERGEATLLEAFERANLLVMASPVYVDTFPFTVTVAMERLADRCAGATLTRDVAAIVQCGFPEPEHADVALAIAARFASEVSLRWCGGLAMGAGGAVNGRDLDELGPFARHQRRALDLAAAALAAGEPIPEEAQAAMRRPLMPRWLYTTMGGLGWHWQAHAQDADASLRARPFDQSEE